MHVRPRVLLNTPDIEVGPAHLLRARANADARLLARASHVLRRKRDGRFLVAVTAGGAVPMTDAWRREPGIDAALRRVHSGLAIDISAPGEPPAEESFEATDAFAWLQSNAGGHDFVMSYPRDNPHGIVYEPWHWCFRG